MMTLSINEEKMLVGLMFLFGGLLLFRDFSGVVLHPRGLRVSQYIVFVASPSLTHHMPYS